ncbi:hypothetical protein BKA67DRAFT_664774 [Truncatella angustata]|uniref:EthD domain-containing protein n=1 Tax=Truncatella angustata TaxID=152316 RepID=A0A9P8UBT5_9PEZI|nr:uncharacterized protein BKA67DRAFT_664774 [Truncatella angustata]KAH6644917.1 hypothetical protein BKA67DRAFT_664774 [Truncatella angustata]KAH8196409.1 hypothetical protein TruAng_009425 [Truncatella angustata]
MSDPVVSLGGPLFRHPGTSYQEFSTSWRRHAQIVTPWFLQFGVTEYIQIHLPPNRSLHTPFSTMLSSSPSHISPEASAQAQKIMAQADGIAIVRYRPVSISPGKTRDLMDGSSHPYFKDVIAADERRFLHTESGATAVAPKDGNWSFDVPALEVDVWKELAAGCRVVKAEELVIIKDGKAEIEVEGLWWNLWHNLDREDVPVDVSQAEGK